MWIQLKYEKFIVDNVCYRDDKGVVDNDIQDACICADSSFTKRSRSVLPEYYITLACDCQVATLTVLLQELRNSIAKCSYGRRKFTLHSLRHNAGILLRFVHFRTQNKCKLCIHCYSKLTTDNLKQVLRHYLNSVLQCHMTTSAQFLHFIP